MLCAVFVVINHPLLETRETFVGGTPQHGKRQSLVNDTWCWIMQWKTLYTMIVFCGKQVVAPNRYHNEDIPCYKAWINGMVFPSDSTTTSTACLFELKGNPWIEMNWTYHETYTCFGVTGFHTENGIGAVERTQATDWCEIVVTVSAPQKPWSLGSESTIICLPFVKTRQSAITCMGISWLNKKPTNKCVTQRPNDSCRFMHHLIEVGTPVMSWLFFKHALPQMYM